MTSRFLYDTYALIELLNKNPNYESYADEEIVINDFIFSEFCYQLIKADEKNAETYLSEVESAIVKLNTKTIRDAMKFRYTHKKQKMSMTDCISYTQAKELGIKFLTGDKEFEHLDNVEFVK
ncbi:PIN domain-containing protein [Candidatus Pacearchaeota archaeon]|nr:PIN domain-containing protein [Candidatus Pacearchaeota archaeon]